MDPKTQSEISELEIPQAKCPAPASAPAPAPAPEPQPPAPAVEVKPPESPELTTLEKAEAVLIEAIKHVAVLAEKEFGHCPSAHALNSRVGNALEMLGSLKREAAILKAPENRQS